MTFQLSWHYLVLETFLLSSVYFLLSTVYCLLSNIYCLQSTVYWLAISYSYFLCLAIPRASSVDFDIPSQGVQPTNDKQTITQILSLSRFWFWLVGIWKSGNGQLYTWFRDIPLLCSFPLTIILKIINWQDSVGTSLKKMQLQGLWRLVQLIRQQKYKTIFFLLFFFASSWYSDLKS